MSALGFDVLDWLAGDASEEDPALRATLASLRINLTNDDGSIALTEVDDSVARTVRKHVHVPAYAVAKWLLLNWWRLRWEPKPARPSREWRRAHCMAAIGGGYAWPAVELASDGEFVQVESHSEASSDVAGIRYLSEVTGDVPGSEFERAIDRFLDSVEGRVAECAAEVRELAELRAELSEERSRSSSTRECRWQALAGLDPGEVPDAWLVSASELRDVAGEAAADEVIATLQDLGDFGAANGVVKAMQESQTTIDLRWAANVKSTSERGELPWQRGGRAAAALREQLGVAPGPVPDQTLEEVLSTHLPLIGSTWRGPRGLAGGFRNGVTNGRTAILVTSRRPESQRFYLARMIACALAASSEQAVLPVTDTATALQKFERAFAQEFLCPWSELDAFTDERGVGEEAIADAAEHFHVSQWLVLSTLVNRRKVPRDRLPAP